MSISSEKERKKQLFRERFHELDILGTGKLNREMVAQILTDQAEDIERLMVILLFEMYDKDGDKHIDEEEYVDFCLEMDNLSEEDILRKIFNFADSDKNGILDVSEVKKLGSLMGLDVSFSDAVATIQALDINHDNGIDFSEFLAILHK